MKAEASAEHSGVHLSQYSVAFESGGCCFGWGLLISVRVRGRIQFL